MKPNPRSGPVYGGIDQCRREGVNFVLAVGGGSTIDSSKAIAAGAVCDGDFWDLQCGKYIDKAQPVGTIMRFAKVAVRVWGCQLDFDHPEVTAKAGIEALRRFFISIGMPRNFAELGAKEEDIPKLVESLCRGNGRTGSLTGFTTLNEQDCASIYRLML